MQPSVQPSAEETQHAFWQLFPVVSLAMFVSFGDNTIVATALPAVAAEFGAPAGATLVISAYLVAMMVAAPVFGRLGDAFGYRTMILPAVALFILPSLLCALAPNLASLVSFRALQGLGGGGLVSLASALLAERIPPRQRAGYQGYIATVVVASYAIGPILSGFLTQYADWRAVFLLNVPFGLTILYFLRRVPPRGVPRVPFRMDVLGTVLLTLFVATLVALFQLLAEGMARPAVGLGMLAVAALAGLIWQERRAPHPLLPAAVMRNPAILRVNAMVVLYGLAVVPFLVFLPIYYRAGHGLAAAQIGLAILPVSVGLVISSLATGRLVARTGRILVWAVMGMAGMAVLLGLLALRPDMAFGTILVVLCGIGLCMGTVLGPVQIVVQVASARGELGSASSTVHVSRLMGAACGTSIVTTLLYATLARDPGTLAAFQAVMAQPDAGLMATRQSAFDTAFAVVFGAIAVTCLAAAWVARSVPIQRL